MVSVVGLIAVVATLGQDPFPHDYVVCCCVWWLTSKAEWGIVFVLEVVGKNFLKSKTRYFVRCF